MKYGHRRNGFLVLIAMNMKVTVMWCVTPSGMVEICLCFGIAFFCSADDRDRGFLRKVGTFGQTTRVTRSTP